MSVIEPYLDVGCYVFMDNYYTSVTLFKELEERKTLACGTVRSNRQGLPKEICGVKEKKVKQLKRGESLYRQKENVTCVTCVMIYVLCHYVITWSFIKHGMVSDVRDFKHSLN